MAHETTLKLPADVVSPADVVRLRHELELLDAFFENQRLRESGTPMTHPPKTSRMLEGLVEQNKVNLLHSTARQDMAMQLKQLDVEAPVVHMSFAVDPSPAVLQRIVGWLRDNIHPLLLVQVGLQPTIAAGCTLQTTNRYFDLSLRHFLSEQHALLTQILHSPAVPAPVEAHHE